MYDLVKNSFKRQSSFYASLGFLDSFILGIIHLFIGWNGIQFVLRPTHLFFLIEDLSMYQTFNSILDSKTNFLPMFAFVIISLVLILYFLHNYFEIVLHKRFFSKDESKGKIKTYYNAFVNYSVPALFHNLWMGFILTSVYLFMLAVYFLLVVFGIRISFDLLSFIKITVFYFAFCLFFFNIILSDFIVPGICSGDSFSSVIKKFFHYFSENKSRIILYYMAKLAIIFTNMFLFIFTLKLVFVHAFKDIYFLSLSNFYNVSGAFTAVGIFVLGLVTSLLINVFWVQIFNVFFKNMFFELFKTYPYIAESNNNLEEEQI